MPIELPKADKVYTHIYDNFKGVDFTNDSTNVWHRRSPDGYNMLPDDSGRPFKRTGWEVVVSADELATACSRENVTINRCHYFELAGIDHIMIFTDCGLLVYREDELQPILSTDTDCYMSYDRAFFFEGNGKSAFYIYGNYKVWEYVYQNGTFVFDESENFADENDRITIPVVMFSTDPSTCVGEILDAFNMLGNFAEVDYQNNDMFHAYTTSEKITVTANNVDFFARKVVVAITQVQFEADKTHYYTKSGGVFIQCTENDSYNALETYYEVWTPARGEYTFTYDETLGQWDLEVGGVSTSNVDPKEYGISYLGSPDDNDKIVLLYIYGVLLPNNVAQNQSNDLIVKHSVFTQFDDELTVIKEDETLILGTVQLHTDTSSYPETDRRAWLEFYSLESPLVKGEDAISVVYPTTAVTITTEIDLNSTGSCQIIK